MTWGQMYLPSLVCQGFDSRSMDRFVIFKHDQWKGESTIMIDCIDIRLKQHCLNLGIIITIAAKT